MKKALKITWITLASLIGLVLIVAIIAFWLVLTPKRMTSLVQNQAPKFINCDFTIGKVDVTLFKTFPDIGVEIDDLVLVNPMKDSPSDTLASVEKCIVSANIKRFLFKDEIIVNGCHLQNGYFNVFTNAEGMSNLDIFPASSDTQEDTTSSAYNIDVQNISLNGIKVYYSDLFSGIKTEISDLSLLLKGNMRDNLIAGDMNLSVKNLNYQLVADSLSMEAAVNDLIIKGKTKIANNDINADLTLNTGKLQFFSSESYPMSANLDNASFAYNGDIKSYDIINGIINMNINALTFFMEGEKYVDAADISMNMPVDMQLGSMSAKFSPSNIKFNDIQIDLNGDVDMPENGDIQVNMDINTNTIIVEDVVNLIPESMRKEMLAGINVKGNAKISAHAEGVYNKNSMPIINADIVYNDGTLNLPDYLPYPITAFNTSLHADIDLNNKSDVTVNSLNARMKNSSFAVSGKVNDLMNKMLCNLKIDADVVLDEMMPFLPEDIKAKGKVKAKINAKCTLDQLTNMELMKTKISGNLLCHNLDVIYYDTIMLKSTKLDVDFTLPNPAANSGSLGLASVKLKGDNIDAKIVNMMDAALTDFNIDAQVSNILDEKQPLSAFADFGFSNIDFNMDDIVFHSINSNGTVAMLPSNNSDNTTYIAVYSGDSLAFAMGDEMSFNTESINFNVFADYDEKQQDVFLQWNPKLDLNLSNAFFEMEGLKEPIIIPSIDCDYSSEGLAIESGNVILGESDFELTGTLTGIRNFIQNDDLLYGDLHFNSDYTNVNQLMDFFSGMGTSDSILEQPVAVIDTVKKEDEPFMVPMGVDIKLNTTIKRAKAGEMDIENVAGLLTVKDGVLILEQMGFTSNAARMQLTAMYKSPRKNHLFVGLDFHLLDIDIAEMIRIVPDIDTVVPMLKSFAGKAEFHLAIETWMKSNYELKMSTLKGATAIEGHDLVVLDSETFDMISDYLMFKNKTENKIDSLSVEMTVFRNEVDVYPFLISMDKYQAVISGRHNLDMSFDYNISVLSPSVVNRLGLKVSGNLDDIQYKLTKSKYANLYNAEKRTEVQDEVLRLKKIISDALKANVKK